MSLSRVVVGVALAAGCSGAEDPSFSEPPADIPGLETPKSEASVQSLVGREPLTQLGTVYVNGFHFAADDPSHQMEANHYCHSRGEALAECAVFDVYGRLTGVEHIVSREAFDALGPKERRLWHPHTYEVKSGMLVAPALSDADEHALMERLVTTYGKIWHVYPAGDEALPSGGARLMKGFTRDGQLDASLLKARDARFGISAEAKRQARADIVDPGFDPIVLEVGPPPGTEPKGIMVPGMAPMGPCY